MTVSATAALPASVLAGVSIETACGAASALVGVVIVNITPFDVPEELVTETVAVAEEAVSMGRIAAVSSVELTTVVARSEPFQLTSESLVKVVPLAAFTVRVRPLGLLHMGTDAGEMDPITGVAPGAALTVKGTKLEISVVVV